MIERHTNRPNRPCDVRLVNKIILVADDNPVMRDALCKLFEPEDGLELCEQAVNGQDAIDKAKKFRPDLIILDFSMPVMNGIDAARAIKKIMPRVPIILSTIHGNEMLSAAAKEGWNRRIRVKGRNGESRCPHTSHAQTGLTATAGGAPPRFHFLLRGKLRNR
jgi:CheY-like chemotaxis protein